MEGTLISPFLRYSVGSVPTIVVPAVGRNRQIQVYAAAQAPTIWIGGNRNVTPVNGAEVPVISIHKRMLGPTQEIYAVTVGPGQSVLFVATEDIVEEGKKDDRSGAAGDEAGGGGPEEVPEGTKPPKKGRKARK